MIYIEDIVYPLNEFDAKVSKAKGISGVIVKAGQGEVEYRGWRDVRDMCIAEDMPWGTYWLPDARYAPDQQKAAIKRTFPNWEATGPLQLWLDCEKPLIAMEDGEYNKLPYKGYHLIDSIWSMCRSYFGSTPHIYTGPHAWDLITMDAPVAWKQNVSTQSLLWQAQYQVLSPDKINYWDRPFFWQFREGPDYSVCMMDDMDFINTFGVMPNPLPFTGDQDAPQGDVGMADKLIVVNATNLKNYDTGALLGRVQPGYIIYGTFVPSTNPTDIKFDGKVYDATDTILVQDWKQTCKVSINGGTKVLNVTNPHDTTTPPPTPDPSPIPDHLDMTVIIDNLGGATYKGTLTQQ